MSNVTKIHRFNSYELESMEKEKLKKLVQSLSNDLEERNSEVRKIKQDINQLNEVVAKITSFDFSEKAPTNDSGDVLDIFGTTVNIFSDELQSFNLSLEHVHNIIYSIPDLVFVLDKDFKITRVNKAIQDFKLEDSDVLFHLVDQYFDKRKFSFSKFKERVRTTSIKGKEYIFLDGNKKGVPVLMSCSMVLNEDGQGEGYVMVIRDVTISKKREEELKKAKEAAEQAALAKSQFLSTMSHEIRTPMNAVLGIAHLLIAGEPRKDQIQNLKSLRFSAENLLVLVNDVLDMSKIETGKVVFRKEKFSINELIENIKESFSGKMIKSTVKLNSRLDDQIPQRLVGDKVRLTQVLTNLIGNAVKFTNDGEIQVRTYVMKKDQNKVKLKFEIVDTGIGIPDTKLDSIFDDFTQVDSSNTRRYGGTGLGLSICKRLLDLQGGAIQVSSRVGKGSVFTFYITYDHEETQKFDTVGLRKNTTTIKKDKFNGFNGAKVLLVEDNPVNVIVTNQFLKIWDFKVDVAKNGAEAVSKILSKNYDIILMDLQMPIMDGFEATKQIRKMTDSIKSEIPIIALTASAMIEDREHVLSIGMNDHVAKPFNPDELFNKMKKLLIVKV